MPEEFGLINRFHVEVGGLDLGNWATCKGLQVTFETKHVDAGGFYDQPMLFPERITYKELELSRAMSAASSAAVFAWLTEAAAEWQLSPEFCVGMPAEIVLFDSRYEPVFAWTFPQVFAKEWRGPELTAKANDVAVETLILSHGGFLA